MASKPLLDPGRALPKPAEALRPKREQLHLDMPTGTPGQMELAL